MLSQAGPLGCGHEKRLMTVWRIKMNSGRPGVDWDGARAYARRAGVVGLGWGPEELRTGAPLDAVLAAVETTEGWTPTGPRMIRRLGQAAVGDLVWTRDRAGDYWLGRIAGPLRFDGSQAAFAHDLNNVRDCEWLRSALRDYEVPGSVVRNFAGTGETLRRIKQPAATLATELLWGCAGGDSAERTVFTAEEALEQLMDPTDVEDVVLLWMQAQGWLLLPSSRMHDTQIYEAALRHRDDGRLAVVSVKSGRSAEIPVALLRAAAHGAEAFAFSTHNAYSEPPEAAGVRRIEVSELTTFMRQRPELLPPRTAQWL